MAPMPPARRTEDGRPGADPAGTPGTGEDRDIFPTVYRSADDASDVVELARAERAAARHGATPDQAAGVAAAGQVRRAEDRLEGWRGRHRR